MAHLDLSTGTYAAADTLLGSRSERRIGHNTRLHRTGGPVSGPLFNDDGAVTDVTKRLLGYPSAYAAGIAVRYHATDIVTLSSDGWLTMNTGGWDTSTTWSRINALLPGPWAVHSRNGSRYLYHGGRPITPYADGLAVHTATGAVGMGGNVLLTADDVDTIAAAYDAAQAARADKRAARLLREHPTAGGPNAHRANLGWNGRPRGCDRCDAEMIAERAARQDALHAAHEAGAHVAAVNTWQDGCPWECPDRPNRYR